MGVPCGNCNHIISDVGTCDMGILYPEPDDISGCWQKAFEVFECRECGALTLYWCVWPNGEDKTAVFLPKEGKYLELMNTRNEEFFTTSDN